MRDPLDGAPLVLLRRVLCMAPHNAAVKPCCPVSGTGRAVLVLAVLSLNVWLPGCFSYQAATELIRPDQIVRLSLTPAAQDTVRSQLGQDAPTVIGSFQSWSDDEIWINVPSRSPKGFVPQQSFQQLVLPSPLVTRIETRSLNVVRTGAVATVGGIFVYMFILKKLDKTGSCRPGTSPTCPIL